METLKRRSRVDGGVLEADLLEHVHHEVGRGPALRRDARAAAGRSPVPRLRVGEIVRVASVGSATGGGRRCDSGVGRVLGGDDQAGGAERSALEEVTPVDRISHGALLVEGYIICRPVQDRLDVAETPARRGWLR